MKIEIDGKQIFYDKVGSGKPILFVHGWGGTRLSLKKLADSLSPDFSCYLADLPGFGCSSAPEKNWGIEEYSELLIEFINKIGVKPVILFGHSFGGAIGIYMAYMYPEYFSKIVLSGASYIRRGSNEKTDVSRIQKILQPLRRLYYKIFYPSSDILKFPNLESNFRKVVSRDLKEESKQIRCKTLLLWGGDDIETPLNDAYILNRNIKGSVLKVYGSVGHELPVYYSELIVKEIRRFIQ